MSDSLRPHGLQHARLPVHHQLPESTQPHILWVDDAIQPSHPLLFPSPPALNLSQHQGLFQWLSSSLQVAKVLEFQLQHQSFQWTFRADFSSPHLKLEFRPRLSVCLTFTIYVLFTKPHLTENWQHPWPPDCTLSFPSLHCWPLNCPPTERRPCRKTSDHATPQASNTRRASPNLRMNSTGPRGPARSSVCLPPPTEPRCLCSVHLPSSGSFEVACAPPRSLGTRCPLACEAPASCPGLASSTQAQSQLRPQFLRKPLLTTQPTGQICSTPSWLPRPPLLHLSPL